MSNNIYDILKKMQTLEEPKKALTESKAMNTVKELHNESKKEKSTSKGTIAEAVAQVEKQLNEKYMGFKKTVAAIKKGGSADNPEAVAASIGRKKYGKEKFQKAAAAGKKMGEGFGDELNVRTWKSSVPDFVEKPQKITNPHYTPGSKNDPRNIQDPRTMYTDDSGVKYDKAGNPSLKKGEDPYMKAMKSMEEDTRLAMQRGPGADMIRYEKDSPAPGAKKHRDDTAKAAKAFRSAGGKIGAGDEVGRDAVSYSRNEKGNAALGDKQLSRYSRNEDVLSPKQQKFAKLAPPPDKITYADKIAGAKKGQKDEGNEFSGALAQAKASGAKSFKVGGKEYNVTNEGWDEMQDYLKKKEGPQPKGGSGKKAGSRYGGSAQKDDEGDQETGEHKKSRGRPKKDKFAR